MKSKISNLTFNSVNPAQPLGRELLIVFLFLSLLWLFVFFQTGIVFSGFHFIDDHQIVQMNGELNQENFSLLEVIRRWLIVDYNASRFRPVYYIHRVLQTYAFGVTWSLWYLYNATLAICSSFFLFLFARLIKFTFIEALLVVFAISLGEQAVIWWRLGPAETLGTFFLSLSLMLIGFEINEKQKKRGRLFSWLAVLALIMMSLCKESFIIAVPSILIFWMWLHSIFQKRSLTQSIRYNLAPFLSTIAILTLEILYIKFVIGTGGTGYAGIDESTFDWNRILETTINLFQKTKLSVPLFFAACMLTWILFPKKISSKLKSTDRLTFAQILIPSLILFVGLTPQILLYAKSGISGFYLFPSVIFLYFGVVGFFSLVKNQSSFLSKLSYFLILGVFGFNLLGSFDQTRKDFKNYALEGFSTSSLFGTLENCTGPNDEILVVVNPRVHYELSGSLKTYLDVVSKRDSLLIRTYGLEGATVFSDTLQKSEQVWSFLDPEAVLSSYNNNTLEKLSSNEDVDAVIVLSPFLEEFIENEKNWFSETKFSMSEHILYFMGGSMTLYCQIDQPDQS